MNIREEIVDVGTRRLISGQVVFTDAEWELRRHAKSIGGDGLKPLVRMVGRLDDGMVHAEILQPIDFKAGQVIRFVAP